MRGEEKLSLSSAKPGSGTSSLWKASIPKIIKLDRVELSSVTKYAV